MSWPTPICIPASELAHVLQMQGERLNDGLSMATAGEGLPLVFLPGLSAPEAADLWMMRDARRPAAAGRAGRGWHRGCSAVSS